MDADVPWQNFVYFAITIPSLPLYILILVVIIHRRVNKKKFTTTFYGLLLSLGFADIFSQITGSFTNIIRTCNLFNEFYWNNRAWVAPFSYNCVMFCMNLRMFGAALIAIQRFLVVCWHSHHWAEKFTQIPLSITFLAHWLPPFFYTLPILTNFNKTLMGPNDMRLYIPNELSNTGSLMQNIWVLFTFSFSFFCYMKIFLLIIRHKVDGAGSLRKEIRLSVVALGQAVAFTVMFAYYTLCYFLAITESPYQNLSRPYMTIFTGVISYWNPWVYVLLNGELRREIKRIFVKEAPSEGAIPVSSTKSSQQNGWIQSQRKSF